MLPAQSPGSRRRIATVIKDGDWLNPRTIRNRLTPEQQRLAVRYLPVAKKYAGFAKRQVNNDYDTAFAVASFGLVRAAGKHDGNDPGFATQLMWAMRRAMHDYRKKQSPEKVIYQTHLSVRTNLVDDAPDRRERSQTHAREVWEKVVPRLSGVQQNVFDMRFCHGAELAEVGLVLGVSKQRVAVIEQAALARCREMFGCE